jgi:hypothetical protein
LLVGYKVKPPWADLASNSFDDYRVWTSTVFVKLEQSFVQGGSDWGQVHFIQQLHFPPVALPVKLPLAKKPVMLWHEADYAGTMGEVAMVRSDTFCLTAREPACNAKDLPAAPDNSKWPNDNSCDNAKEGFSCVANCNNGYTPKIDAAASSRKPPSTECTRSDGTTASAGTSTVEWQDVKGGCEEIGGECPNASRRGGGA